MASANWIHAEGECGEGAWQPPSLRTPHQVPRSVSNQMSAPQVNTPRQAKSGCPSTSHFLLDPAEVSVSTGALEEYLSDSRSLVGSPGCEPCWFSKLDVLGIHVSGADLKSWEFLMWSLNP